MGDHADDTLDQMIDDLDGDYQFDESPHYGWETRKSTHWARVDLLFVRITNLPEQCMARRNS